MDKDEMMLLERDKYIRSANAGDRDWATQNDPQETLHALGRVVMRGDLDMAMTIVERAIEAAADSHIQQMDDLGRLDAPDIIADLRAAATDMQSLAESIRNVK